MLDQIAAGGWQILCAVPIGLVNLAYGGQLHGSRRYVSGKIDQPMDIPGQQAVFAVAKVILLAHDESLSVLPTSSKSLSRCNCSELRCRDGGLPLQSSKGSTQMTHFDADRQRLERYDDQTDEYLLAITEKGTDLFIRSVLRAKNKSVPFFAGGSVRPSSFKVYAMIDKELKVFDFVQ